MGAILGPAIVAVIGSVVVFRGGREDRSKSVVDASLALLNEVQEERSGWKERVEAVEKAHVQTRSELEGVRNELRDARKEHRQCQTDLSELRAERDQNRQEVQALKTRCDELQSRLESHEDP